MEKEPQSPIRILNNGVQITDERIVDNGDEISFEFELANTDFDRQFMRPRLFPGQTIIGTLNPPREVLDYLSDLYTAGSGDDSIVVGLRKKGWLDDEGTVLVQFTWKMILDRDRKTVAFVYTKSNTVHNTNLDLKN